MVLKACQRFKPRRESFRSDAQGEAELSRPAKGLNVLMNSDAERPKMRPSVALSSLPASA